jgi:hypothetical protein
MIEVYADRMYCTRKNYVYCKKLGGTFYSPFKINAIAYKNDPIEWLEKFKLYDEKPDEFYAHYDGRSMAESAIFSIKAKLSQNIRSRNKIAQENEVLIKVLLHNIFLLSRLNHYLPLEIDFRPLGEVPVFQRSGPKDEKEGASSINTRKWSRGIISRLDNKVRCSYCFSSVTAIKNGKPFWPVADPLTCYNCYQRHYQKPYQRERRKKQKVARKKRAKK